MVPSGKRPWGAVFLLTWRENASQPHREVLSDAPGRFYIEGLCRESVEITTETRWPAGGQSKVKISEIAADP